MSDLNSLTDDILKLIMHHVPARDRLISCCLVSSRWHAAAVAATDALELGPRDWVPSDSTVRIYKSQRAKAALEWLGSWGQHVTSLDFHSFGQTLQQLPCPSLLELRVVDGCCVQLGRSASPHPGVIPGCTNLTKLLLTGCNILDSRGGAEICGSLSSLVHLQHLHVHPRDEQDEWCTIEGFTSGTLPCLQQLTFLNVYNLSSENISELSALTNLQDLGLKADSSVVVGPNNIPGLVLPKSLEILILWGPFAVVEAEILLAVPTGLKDLCFHCAVEGPEEGPGSLLSCMALVQNLTKLHLYVAQEDVDLPPPGPAYSALTASSNLVELCVYGNGLPVGVWPFMFPAARTLPHLTHFGAPFAYGCNEPVLHGAWGAADVACLVRCCPNLRTIEELAMQYGSHVSQLHKLTALTKAELNYGAAADRSAVQETMHGLTALTQLRGLSVNVYCYVVGVAAVLPLTALTSLSSMSFTCSLNPLDPDNDDLEVEVYLHQEASGPAVWLQLLERCAAERDCSPEGVRRLAQQLAAKQVLIDRQQQLLAHKRQQLLAQQQVNSDQQDQLAAQQLQIAELQQQLAAQRQVAAEQAAQIAGLQAQGMQLLQLQGQLQELQLQQQQLLRPE